MLTISQRQLDELNELAERRFESHLAGTISTLLPKVVARLNGQGKARLHEAIRTGRERAAGYDIDGPPDVAVFIAFLVAAVDLDEQGRNRLRDWTVPFLQRAGSPGRVRLALAEHALRRKAPTDALAAQLCTLADAVRGRFGATR
jgi:hypothetical protein